MWLDPVLFVAVALTAGALAVVEPLPTVLAALSALALVRAHVSRLLLALCLLAFALSAWRAKLELDAFRSAYAAARSALGPPQRCAVWGRIRGSPTESDGRPLYTLQVERADCESGKIAPNTGVRLAGGPPGMARGDRIEAIAELAPLELLHNLDLGDPVPRAARRDVLVSGTALHAESVARGSGLQAWVDRARAFVRLRIQRSFAADAVPMARALVLGENDLDPADDAAFKKSGLSHMLAVSGTHLVFAVLSLVRALTALLVRCERLSQGHDVGRYAAFAGALLALGYADFAGGSGSAWRAAWMLSAAFAARVTGRAPCPSRALAASLLVGWLVDPLIAFDISFLLSLAATAGLMLLGEPLAAPCERLRSRVARYVGASIATTLAAMIPCAPLLALLGSELTLAGVFANVLAAPLGETIALPLCLTHALVSFWPPLEQGIALVASGALLIVKQIAHESANATFLALPLPEPNGFQLALVSTSFLALVLGRVRAEGPRWRKLWVVTTAVGLGVIELGIRSAGAPRGSLVMTALSVGQGDSTLLDLPDGSLMLIDAGGVMAGADPGERVVVPSLRARRRRHVDVVVLTHPHPDHFGGLLAVLRAVTVGEIWDTGHASPSGAGPVYAEFRREAARRGVRIRGPGELCTKQPLTFGAARVHVLSPCPGPVSGWSANDNSFVFKVSLGRRALLLTGDAEHAAEEALLASSVTPLSADVLKIGHHGSRSSTTAELIAAVAPRVATISCGTRNRFGHPAPQVTERLEHAGVRALRTDRSGGIRIRTDGESLRLEVAEP